MHDEYMTVTDAAAELGVARATLWRWLKRAGVETYRFMGDRRTYVKREDVTRLAGPVPVPYQAKTRRTDEPRDA